jgi:hypothetical protein
VAVHGPRPAPAEVQVAGHREEPWGEPRVVDQRPRPRHQPQPRLLQQVLRHVAAAAQPDEEGVEARAIGLVDRLEGGRVPGLEAGDEADLDLALHEG